jgi:hypothetical protein
VKPTRTWSSHRRVSAAASLVVSLACADAPPRTLPPAGSAVPKPPRPKPKPVVMGHPPMEVSVVWGPDMHEPRFTPYAEQIRPVFEGWRRDVEACFSGCDACSGQVFDLALVVGPQGELLDATVKMSHFAGPFAVDLERDAVASCVVDVPRRHREPLPRPPDWLELRVWHPYVVSARVAGEE